MDRATAEGVGESGEEERGEGLEDYIEGYCEVDCLEGGVEVGLEEGDEGKVDCCR